MANNASKLSSLDAEKADRAAASIRPSWDFDHADFEAAPAPAAKVETFDKKLALPAPPPAVAAAPVPFAAGADIPRDTVIDGMPTVSVGRTIDIGPAPEDVQAKPDRAPPPARPQATRFGLGSDPGQAPAAPTPGAAAPTGKTSNGTSILPRTSPEAVAAAAAAEAASVQAPAEAATGASELPLPPKRIEPTAAFTPGDVGEIAPLEIPVEAAPAEATAGPAARVDSVAPAAPRPSAPIAPIAASISRIEDPIEIPRKSSGPIFWVIGGAVALAAIIGGVVLLTGGDKTPANEPTKSTSNAAADKPATATPAPTTPPAPTTAATPATSATPEVSATTSATSAPSAEASAAPSAKPTTAPTAVAATTPPKPTGTAPKPPPPKGTGGIRRDTPF